jgi:putative SOS response-associated peptidase YedK
MPFVLNADTLPAWLDTTAHKEHLQPLMRPCPDTQLQAHKVDKKAVLKDTAEAVKPSVVKTLWD